MTGGRAAKVLLVDDRRENLIALEAILQGLPLETVAVTSGEDALKLLLADDFATILLDANMPGMDGYETAGHIKQRERTSRIPIVFLTAEGYDARLAFRGYQAGAVDYITKPFDPWVLRSKVEVFVEMWTMNAELADRVADYQVLSAAVEQAAELLEGSPPAAAQAAALLRDAQARLVSSAPVTAGW